jgi:polar amino acid transport system substrate-binding protein
MKKCLFLLLIITSLLFSLSGKKNQTVDVKNYFNTPASTDIAIISAHPEYPPVMWNENDQIVGIGPDLAKLIFKDLGIKCESKYAGPWSRVIESGKNGNIDIISGIYLTEERAKFLDYTVAFMTDPVAVFYKKNSPINFNKWDDLIGKKGVTTLGDSWGEDFDKFIKDKLQMSRTEKVEQCLQILDSGRADYMIFALYPGIIQINKLKFQDKFIFFLFSIFVL